MNNSLPRSTPEQQGIASGTILKFLEALERDIHETHSLILVRHGHIIAEGGWAPYAPHLPHMLYSLSKSFTSTAIGMAVTEGRIAVTDPVIEYFPTHLPPTITPNLAAMQIQHLLSMSTGHAEEPYTREDTNWVEHFLAAPVPYEPGTHFLYNSAATYMLSAIVQQVTGLKLIDYLRPRLFEPLGIERPTWEESPQGINTGGWGLSITTEDIARFGQLYLQKGQWQGQQLVPTAWVEAATTAQIANGDDPNSDWAQGYGYQFWCCRHQCYRGDGAFGQYCVVMPQQDAVLAITSGVAEMQPTLNLVWEHLLPAMQHQMLEPNPTEQAALAQRLTGLALTPPQGAATSPQGAQFSGKRYQLDQNMFGFQTIQFDFGSDSCQLRIETKDGVHHLPCGYGIWRMSNNYMIYPEGQVAASAIWLDDATLEVIARHYETPYYSTLNCHFDGSSLRLTLDQNVGFDGPLHLVIAGQAST